MKRFLQSNSWEVGIVLTSTALYLAILLLPFKAKQFGDGDFHKETKTIVLFLTGHAEYADLSITKAPGPVLFYVIPYVVAGAEATDENYWRAGVVWVYLLTTMTLVLLYRSTKWACTSKVSRCFIILFFFPPLYVYYSLGIMAESLAFLGVCWMVIAMNYKDRKKYFYPFFTIGLASLILARPNAGLSIPILLFFFLLFYLLHKDRELIKYGLAAVAAFFIVAGISLVVKNLPNTRQTLKQEEYLAFVMHHGRFQFRTETFDWRFWDDQTRADSKDYNNWRYSVRNLQSKIRKEKRTFSSVYYEWVIADVQQYPVTLVKQFFVRIIFGNTLQISSVSMQRFAIGGVSGKTVYWITHVALNIFNYAVFALAVSFTVRRENFQRLWPLLSVVLALWIFHGLIYMEQRYLFPSRPIILLLASLEIARLADIYNSKKNKRHA